MQVGPAPLRGTETPLSLAVCREADVAPAVAAALRYCTGQGCSPVLAAHVATAASELANNLWMHASRGGRITLRAVRRGGRLGVELNAEDQGPGIANIEQAMREGYSTGGGLGCGLPGVQRLMDEFEMASVPGQGTRVTARKWLPLLR